MKLLIVSMALVVAMTVSTDRLAAQSGRGSRDDGAAARSDALLGTPNRSTPVPQTNLFSTAPGLEQQAPPAATGKATGSENSKGRGNSVEEKSH
jgi:hypothetical protein